MWAYVDIATATAAATAAVVFVTTRMLSKLTPVTASAAEMDATSKRDLDRRNGRIHFHKLLRIFIHSFIHSFIDTHKAAEKIQKHNKNST